MSEAESGDEVEQADDLFGRWLAHHARQTTQDEKVYAEDAARKGSTPAAPGPEHRPSNDMDRQTPGFEPIIMPSIRKRMEQPPVKRGLLRNRHRASGPADPESTTSTPPPHPASGYDSAYATTSTPPAPPEEGRRLSRSTSGDAPDWLKDLRSDPPPSSDPVAQVTFEPAVPVEAAASPADRDVDRADQVEQPAPPDVETPRLAPADDLEWLRELRNLAVPDADPTPADETLEVAAADVAPEEAQVPEEPEQPQVSEVDAAHAVEPEAPRLAPADDLEWLRELRNLSVPDADLNPTEETPEVDAPGGATEASEVDIASDVEPEAPAEPAGADEAVAEPVVDPEPDAVDGIADEVVSEPAAQAEPDVAGEAADEAADVVVAEPVVEAEPQAAAPQPTANLDWLAIVHDPGSQYSGDISTPLPVPVPDVEDDLPAWIHALREEIDAEDVDAGAAPVDLPPAEAKTDDLDEHPAADAGDAGPTDESADQTTAVGASPVPADAAGVQPAPTHAAPTHAAESAGPLDWLLKSRSRGASEATSEVEQETAVPADVPAAGGTGTEVAVKAPAESGPSTWVARLRGGASKTPADPTPAAEAEVAQAPDVVEAADEPEVAAEVEAPAPEAPAPDADVPDWKSRFRGAVERHDPDTADQQHAEPGAATELETADGADSTDAQPEATPEPDALDQPEPDAVAASQASTPARTSTTSTTPVAAIRDPHEFAPKRATRRLVTAVFVIGLAATAYVAWQAYQAPDQTSIAVAAVAAFATAIIWAIRATTTVTRLTVRNGQLEVIRDGGRFIFDLTSQYTPVEFIGTPGRRGWKALFVRRGMPPFELDSSVVDPEEFTRVVRYYRPGDPI